MSVNPNFFVLIIGTEILNRRRTDKHFDFVSQALQSRGEKLMGCFVIEDDPTLITQAIQFIKTQPDSVLFSFGGIGSTPDDHTRQCAAAALSDGQLTTHPQAKKIIEERLGERAYPHPILMAELPKGAQLLDNPVNKMPAFSLEDRFFFMPGFPNMSHPMVTEILAKHFAESRPYYRKTLTALCRENELIEVMRQMPKGVEFSSLPKHYSDGWRTTISVASHDKEMTEKAFATYTDELERENIHYSLSET